ncbi:MAG TPA: hypothetical protein VGJ13_00225 [Pseudonocardiaceae bacterium]
MRISGRAASGAERADPVSAGWISTSPLATTVNDAGAGSADSPADGGATRAAWLSAGRSSATE